MLRKLWGKKGIPNSSRIEDVLIEQNRELSNVLNMLVKNSGPGRSIIELRDIERAIKNPEIESRELTIKRILYIEKYLTDLFYEVYKVLVVNAKTFTSQKLPDTPVTKTAAFKCQLCDA
ncbi:Uncharacterised protein [Klebsiella pneumoniae]|uniref:Uncharacterized protein n=1 Tax=Klebsiella pneumoniae TaxID=573 RepID=A0A377YPV1_KLEPN|nr:hypothetical protein [Klebsiella pneumoniae]EJK88732.1 hypothetical protein UUU_03300 [Klebsiella pneumoniae subsp. pneumoniae DSM 30104 = JCM 1662 = NBRC 14940]KFJ78233.1 hypothetical protein DR88_5166 [Klebsiella pneumoniae]KHF67472.1 hypothetical protein LV59_03558 [Klebsiella pneumoniae]MDP8008781.1 hypothetical protein [Klebsiella pneumoniae subsp. pneumoniae]MDP8022640.1 hypothetical protein [Klebsiella pneumoniae subsp. pneumoniae]